MESIKKRLFFIALYAALVYACKAQTSGIILDVETREPVAGVQIYTNTNKIITTNKSGRYSIFVPFASFTISRNGYLKRTLDKSDLKDTIYILPKSVSLNEVVVTAAAPRIGFNIKKMTSETAQRYGVKPSGMNFLSIFERHRVSGKERERRHKAVANY